MGAVAAVNADVGNDEADNADFAVDNTDVDDDFEEDLDDAEEAEADEFRIWFAMIEDAMALFML
jgi:hypothetical protein